MKRIGLGTSVRALTAAFSARSLVAERALSITSGVSMDHARAVREIERGCKQPCARKRVVCRARIAAARAKETECTSNGGPAAIRIRNSPNSVAAC